MNTSYRDAVISLDLYEEITYVGLLIGRDLDAGDKRVKTVFNTLLSSKQSIEHSFGEPLEWKLDQAEPCEYAMIFKEIEVGGYGNEDAWDSLQDIMLDIVIRFERAIEPFLARLHVS